MAGVSGKSRGCKPCRDRKIGCDGKRPQCSRCISTQQPCRGYNDSILFVNEFSQEPRRAWRKRKPAKKTRGMVKFDQGTELTHHKRQDQLTIIKHYCYLTEQRATGGGSLAQTISQYPTKVLELSQTFVQLYFRNTSQSSVYSKSTNLNLPGTWASDIPSWTGRSELIDTAIVALATAFISNHQDDIPLAKASISVYSRALKLYREAIAKMKPKDIDNMIATSLLMGLVELHLRTESSAGYQTHVDGGSQLLIARGPVLDKVPFSKACSLNMRHQVLISGLIYRTDIIFSRPEWQTILPSQECDRICLFERWSHVMFPFPSILEQADKLDAEASSGIVCKRAEALGLLYKIATVEQKISAWCACMTATILEPIIYFNAATSAGRDCSKNSASKGSSTNYPIFPNPIDFASPDAAIFHLLYWASLILIDTTAVQLQQHVVRVGRPLAHLPFTSPSLTRADSTEVAAMICRSVDYCLDKTSLIGHLLFPLIMAQNYYIGQGDKERVRWCLEKFNWIERYQGFRLGFEMMPHSDESQSDRRGGRIEKECKVTAKVISRNLGAEQI